MVVVWILYLAVIVLTFAGMWKAFEKAGQPGWAGIVPVYNIYVLIMMARKPAWWLLLCFVPCVNIVVLIIVFIEIAKQFGKDAGYGVGLALLGFVFWPMLGFGDATYQGTAGGPPTPPPPAPPTPPAEPPAQQ